MIERYLEHLRAEIAYHEQEAAYHAQQAAEGREQLGELERQLELAFPGRCQLLSEKIGSAL